MRASHGGGNEPTNLDNIAREYVLVMRERDRYKAALERIVAAYGKNAPVLRAEFMLHLAEQVLGGTTDSGRTAEESPE